MPNNEYFGGKRDKTIVEAGGFFCHACLVGKPAIEQSPDDRYCNDCYEFLLKEAETLTGHQRADWRPRVTITGRQSEAKPTVPIPEVGGGIMSTLTEKKSEVDIIHPADAPTAIARSKRGPKHKTLPEDLIRQLAGEGMGGKAIAARLKGKGITVSYKTIQRLLSGEREIQQRVEFQW